jgi:tripartite ATP-independent transporter DctM subunit
VSPDTVALLGFVALFALMLLRVPVGMAMGLVGVVGYAWLVGGGPALKQVGTTSMRTVTSYQFGVIPMFLLMGAFVSASGVSRELFRAANTLVGHWRGGLGLATVFACGGFRRDLGLVGRHRGDLLDRRLSRDAPLRLPQSFATGVIAAGGTLGAMLPPRPCWQVYGLITQQDVGKLFMAGILPGLLAMLMYMLTIALIVRVRPDYLPTVPKASLEERLQALRDVWAPVLLFVFVVGGLYGGVFTPTEAGGVGASGAFLLGVLRGRLGRTEIRASLLQATRTRRRCSPC